MDKKIILEAIKKIKENSKKRNFKQSVDLIVNFKDLNLKKTDEQLDLFVQLHKSKDKKSKICAFVGPELLGQAKEVCDKAVSVDEFENYAKDKKECKTLSRDFDFFIAQANIMPKMAAAFGKFLAPLGKMPSPKAGCIVPPNANLKQLYDKLQKTVRVSVKKDPLFQCSVGYEDKNDDELMDNIETVYNYIESHLPNGKRNISSVYLKLTMGPCIEIVKKSKKKGKEEKKDETKKESKKEEKKAEKEKEEDVKEEGEKESKKKKNKEKPEKNKEKATAPSESKADKAK